MLSIVCHHAHRAVAAAALLLAIGLLGCSTPNAPDLARLYAAQGTPQHLPPVILIHGTLGSRLERVVTGEEYWPGSLRRLAFGRYTDLALPIDPVTLHPARDERLRLAGITEGAAGRDFYGRILRTLQEVAGYVRAVPGDAVADKRPRVYVFEYDWRQDNVVSAAHLHRFVMQIRKDHGNPELQVDVVAHSMGGLIARYYARYGATDVLDNNSFDMQDAQGGAIRRAILLGTPNLGSAAALRTLIRGYKVGLRAIPPEVVATFPSSYQLLPHALNDWLLSMNGTPLRRDQFDTAFWRRFQFSVFAPTVRERVRESYDSAEAAAERLALLERYFAKHIERARRFTWALTVPVTNEDVRYIVFGSDCYSTPARLLVEEVEGVSHLRLRPDEIAAPLPGVDYAALMLEPGDGAVTKASLLARQSADLGVARHRFSHFNIDYPVFLCESHAALTGNVNFQNNLLHALLSPDTQ